MLIFLDTETTGLELEDKICSIALVIVDDTTKVTMYDLVNEGKKIPPKASSINHITNEMIKGKVKLLESLFNVNFSPAGPCSGEILHVI